MLTDDHDMDSDDNDCQSSTVNCADVNVQMSESSSQKRSALFLLKAREERMINQVTLNSLTKDITGQSCWDPNDMKFQMNLYRNCTIRSSEN